VSLKRNFSVALFNSIWTALLGLAVVPLYLRCLGAEAYGLIGFFATTQALLQLLDFGLSPTINREVARCSATGNMAEARNLLHTLSVVYWAMSIGIALLILVVAPLIANNWLQSSHLSSDTVTNSLILMGMVVACRWPVGLYMGALMGMQRVALSSIVGTVFGTLSSLGAVAVLTFISPTIEAFFIWQACVGIAYVAAMYLIAWRIVGKNTELRRFSFDDLKRIWRFSVGMSGLAITGVVLIQMDKVLLSKLLSLEEFGHYVLAGTVANGLYVFLTPLFNSLYPRMTSLVASGNTEKLDQLYKVGTSLFLAIFFPIVILAAIYSQDILYLWTGNSQLAASTSLIVSLLLIGTGLNGVMHFPFALQLAYGLTKLPLTITSILIIILAPLIFILTLLYGATGGALAWLILNLVYLLFGTWLTHRTILKGAAKFWLIHCVGYPFIRSVIILAIGWQLTFVKESYLHNFLWGGCFMLLSILVNSLLMQKEITFQLMQWKRSKN